MRRSYAGQWALLLCGTAALLVWVFGGRAYVRRHFFGPPAARAADRVEGEFLAVLFPRVRPAGGRFTMSERDLGRILDALKKGGYTTVSLADVERLYDGHPLPRKAVLLLFGDDAPGITVADRAIERRRMRAAAFVSRTAGSARIDERQYLTRHALVQMLRGGAWDVGLVPGASRVEPELRGARAVLDIGPDGEAPETPREKGRWPLRFVPSELGHNDRRDDPQALKALALRADRGTRDNLRVIEASWPRAGVFVDDFGRAGLGPDWIRGWGVASAGGRRLALIPAPRQTGAGVFLRGTEKWRDAVIEFELERYQKEFWAYARYADDGSFVRVGARSGYWYVEQKVGPRAQPSMLARSPIVELPARVRFVLKGGSAIMHVDGRMQFGRALRVHPALERGRLLLGVYDVRLKSSLAVLRRVKAGPVPQRWLAFRDGGVSVESEEASLERLREEAVYARAITPRWLAIAPDGRVSVSRDLPLLRSLAGFYSCRLMPMGELPALSGLVAGGAVERLAVGLAEAASALDAPGLNLRLREEDAERPETARVLARLRGGLNARKRELWVTLDAPGAAPELARSVDGVLTAAAPRPPFEVLEAAPARDGSGQSQAQPAQLQ